MPMPTTLPISSWRGVITASSTSTTRDAFSRVTAVSTQPPYVCSMRNSRMLVIIAVPTRLGVHLVVRFCGQGLDVRRRSRADLGGLVRRESGGAQPVLQRQLGAQHVDEGGP